MDIYFWIYLFTSILRNMGVESFETTPKMGRSLLSSLFVRGWRAKTTWTLARNYYKYWFLSLAIRSRYGSQS